MEEKFFLVQIKRTNGTYENGVVVKNTTKAWMGTSRSILPKGGRVGIIDLALSATPEVEE